MEPIFHLFIFHLFIRIGINSNVAIHEQEPTKKPCNIRYRAFWYSRWVPKEIGMNPQKVLEAGLEPARPEEHRILSPACLPIPPLELLIYRTDKSGHSTRAGDEIRTHDPHLGKVMLYP